MGMKFLMLKCGIVKLMLAFCVLHMKLVIGGVIRQNLGINLSPDRFCFLSMDELVLEQNMQQIIPSAQRIGVGRLLVSFKFVSKILIYVENYNASEVTFKIWRKGNENFEFGFQKF